MGHWVYMFSGCPDRGCCQQISNEVEPGEVMVLDRAGSTGIVDGFVRDSVDDVMLVTHYRWVASGHPSVVMPEIMRALGPSRPSEERRL
ncbi:hypothetical protein [Streptomyces sp. NPDC004680]|uniref:hypothetical protein n=1 Tax=Streptomyces sp. NPDC004680 TaxID=3154287 RepID=UPI0033BA0C46